MKICITSSGETVESMLDPRFGRCSYFVVADLESGEHTVIPNIGEPVAVPVIKKLKEYLRKDIKMELAPWDRDRLQEEALEDKVE